MENAMRVLRALWRGLGSTPLAVLQLAAVLLSLLFASLFPHAPADPSSLAPWLASASVRYGRSYGLLRSLGLFDPFRSPWFLALHGSLVVTTLVCTVQRCPRLWRCVCSAPLIRQPEAFYELSPHRAKWPVRSPAQAVDSAVTVLRSARWRYHCWVRLDEVSGRGWLVAQRGRLAPAGTLLSHLAVCSVLVLIMVRPLVSWQLTGMRLQAGQTVEVDATDGLSVRTGRLEVSRGPTGRIGDACVALTVLGDGISPLTRRVGVGRSLTVKGVSFHLLSYSPVADPAASHDEGRASDQPGEDGSTVWRVNHDPTFLPAVAAVGLLLAGLLLSMGVPRRQLWLLASGKTAVLVAPGGSSGFETLAASLAAAAAPAPESAGGTDKGPEPADGH